MPIKLILGYDHRFFDNKDQTWKFPITLPQKQGLKWQVLTIVAQNHASLLLIVNGGTAETVSDGPCYTSHMKNYNRKLVTQ
jgi:hypothetical protein